METTGNIIPSQGGVLPPISLPAEKLEEDFEEDQFDDDLPPLVPMEESDLARLNLRNSVQGDSTQGQAGSSTSSRSPRQLRNRSVARSIMGERNVKFHDVIDCIDQDQHYQESTQFEKEGTLFLLLECRDDLNYLSRKIWEILYDPTPSRALKRTRQQASIIAQHMLAKPHVSTMCLMDQKAESSGYTVLSDAVTKKMDREERKYQKAMMICVQGIGTSLNKSTEALDVVDGLGQSHHDSLRGENWKMWDKNSLVNPVPNIQPWASVIQQTLSHQNVPEYFQRDDTMKYSAEILEEEEEGVTDYNLYTKRYLCGHSRMDNSV